MAFEDPHAEMAVLAGVLRHGRDAYVDSSEFIGSSTLANELHQLIYACFDEHYGGAEDRPLDYATLLSVAKRLGYSHAFDDADAARHVRTLLNYPVELETVRHEAAKLLKLKIGRELHERLRDSAGRLKGITGDETLNHILEMVESPIFEYTASLNGDGHDTKQIGVGCSEWLENVIANPRSNRGIPTPFPIYNRLIGGGFRRGGVAVIGARPKTGKTVCCDNIGLHVAGTLGIPVLNLDTEMQDHEHWSRILAFLSGIPIDRIEEGRLSTKEADDLRGHVLWLESIPYYYRSVIDESFAEQVAAMRRWVAREVGVDDDGARNDCLVIYDYLQLTDPGEFSGNNFKEYQLLGFQMVSLTRLAKKYDIPILSMLQLNRDGIDKKTTAAAAGSDRIIWKCSNFSILSRKGESEIETHGESAGTLWLSNLIARHGAGGRGPHDDISLLFEGETARLSEGKTRGELDRGRPPSHRKGFEVEDDGEDFALE